MSRLPPFSRGRASEFDLERIMASLNNNPIINGEIVTVSLKAGQIKSVLKKPVKGWFIIDKDAEADVWRVKGNERQLVLESNNNVNLKLWVF